MATTIAFDRYDRSVVDDWAVSTSGRPWSSFGNAASDFDVLNGFATHTHTQANVSRRSVMAVVGSSEVQGTFSVSAIALTQPIRAAVMMRCGVAGGGQDDHYRAQVTFDIAGALSLQIIKRSGGSDGTTLASVVLADVYDVGTKVSVRLRITGSVLQATAWLPGGGSPATTISTKDNTFASGDLVGVRTLVSTGNTNTLPVVVSVYDFIVKTASAVDTSTDTTDIALAALGLPPDEVISALTAGVVRIKRRAELYESDGVTPFDISRWDARLTGGSVTVDRDRAERRMCDLTFENDDDSLDLDAIQGFWYDKIIKVFWGIIYDGPTGPASWETQIGEFMIDRIVEGRFPHIVKVTGRDYAKKCLNTKIKSSLQFPTGTPVESIVSALAGNSGITKLRMPFTGQMYDRDLVFERGADRWSIMKQIADSIGYEVYFTADGYLTMRQYPDPSYSPVKWIFKGGEDGTLVDFERSSTDARIRNKIIAIGDSSSNDGVATVIYAEAINDDPQSPTRVSRIGERTEIVESSYFSSQAQAQQFVDARLAVSALEEYEMNFSSVILPWLEGGDIVDVQDEDDNPYVPSRFLLSSFALPLDLGAMTANGRRITLVGVTQDLELL